MLTTILTIQCLSFMALGAMLIAAGNVKLGLAQLCLCAVQWLIYS